MSEEKEDSKTSKIKKEGQALHVEGLGEFKHTTSRLFLSVDNLQISHLMRDSSDKDDPKPPSLQASINGSATVERDKGLGVIGYEHTFTNKVSIDLHGVDDEQLKEIYEKREEILKEREKDGEIEKIFDLSGSEKIFTYASLGFSPSNWEFDTEDSFFASIYIPNKIMDALLKAVKENTIGGLQIGLDMKGFYTNDEMPFVNNPIRFYLVPDEKEPSTMSSSDMRSPASVNGFVSLLRIYEKKRVLSISKIPKDDLSEKGLEENLDVSQGGYAAFLQKALLKIDTFNKTAESIRKAVWVAAFLLAVWLISNV